MKRKLLTGLLLAVFGVGAAHADDAGQPSMDDLRACLAGNMPQGYLIQHLHFRSTGAEADSVDHMRARLFVASRGTAGDGMRAMLRVDEPDYLAGGSYLLIEDLSARRNDGMYVYLPAVRRVRRVEGGFTDTPLLGTQFSYSEFRHWQGMFGDARITVLENAPRDGRMQHRLVLKPAPEVRSIYSRIEVEIDAERCIVMRADYIDRDLVQKELRIDADKVRQVGGGWFPSQITMRDPRRELETVLSFEHVQHYDVLDKQIFSPESFYETP